MQFYAVVAFVAIAAPNIATFRMIAAAAFLATTLMRFGLANAGEWQVGFYSPLSHSSGLFLGAMLATLPLDRLRNPAATLVSSVAILISAFALAEFGTAAALMIWIPLVEIATAGVVASIVRGAGPTAAVLRAPSVRGLGVLSFGIYLWHYPIAVIARAHLEPSIAFILTLSAATLLAAISYRLIELPFLGPRSANSSEA